MAISRELSKNERSQLLFLECRSVDNGGLIDPINMNDEDMSISRRWDSEGYIKFGRLKTSEIRGKCTYSVRLSSLAAKDAAALRRERALRVGLLCDESLCGNRSPHAVDKEFAPPPTPH